MSEKQLTMSASHPIWDQLMGSELFWSVHRFTDEQCAIVFYKNLDDGVQKRFAWGQARHTREGVQLTITAIQENGYEEKFTAIVSMHGIIGDLPKGIREALELNQFVTGGKTIRKDIQDLRYHFSYSVSGVQNPDGGGLPRMYRDK